MSQPVTVHNGYYLIDTSAWLAQRVGAHQAEHSKQLQDFVRCDVFDDYRPTMDTAARMRLWCAAYGFLVGDGDVIEHDAPCLTKPVTIVLAADTGLRRQSLALVSIGDGSPQVYADLSTDPGYWLDTTTVEFSCPAGHRWSWDGGQRPMWYLDRPDGLGGVPLPTTLQTMFGDLPHPPYAPCRDCAAYNNGANNGASSGTNGDTPTVCPCSGTAIYCPHCKQRCAVALADIPTYEETNR